MLISSGLGFNTRSRFEMCGIGGIYRIENNPRIDNGNMEVLFKAIESRGKHACGAAWVWADSDNKVQLFKKATRSSNLIRSGFTTKYIGELLNFVLFHTRYATKGTIENNLNNHPIHSGDVIMTHNGWFTNDEEVWSDLNTPRRAEVDSEALAAALNDHGPQWALNELDGPASIAWVDSNNPQNVNLLTNWQNPLVIGRLENGNIVWASLAQHLFGLPIKDWWHAKPYRLYTLTPNGDIEKHDLEEPPSVYDSYGKPKYFEWSV